MREPFDKLEDEYYQVYNVRVTDIAITPDGIHIYMDAAGGREFDISFPPCDGMIDDLCRIFNVPDLFEIKASENVFARALTHNNTRRCEAIAHLIENCGLLSYDYDEHGMIKKSSKEGPDESDTTQPGMFTMATIDTPPGMPWTIQRREIAAGDVGMTMSIWNAKRECIGLIDKKLAEWIKMKPIIEAELNELREKLLSTATLIPETYLAHRVENYCQEAYIIHDSNILVMFKEIKKPSDLNCVCLLTPDTDAMGWSRPKNFAKILKKRITEDGEDKGAE